MRSGQMVMRRSLLQCAAAETWKERRVAGDLDTRRAGRRICQL